MADVLTPVQRALLQEFLLSKVRQTFQWGTSDCGLLIADWAIMLGYPDPAAAVRGTYSDAEGAYAAIAPLSFQEFVAQCCAACSFSPTDTPQDGDIGIIDLPMAGPTAGIMTNGSWAFKTAIGVTWLKTTQGAQIAAWRVFGA